MSTKVDGDLLRVFGQLLRDRRNAMGWSRQELAKRAGLSDSTIKFIERARHPPSRATLIRLQNIPALELSFSDFPDRGTAPPRFPQQAEDREKCPPILRCHMPPFVDSVRQFVELGNVFRGSGGHVDQVLTYLDHHGAADYLRLCHDWPISVALRSQVPLAQMAKYILRSRRASLQVIALGVADGALETRLIQCLHSIVPDTNLELCLLDISLPLLSCAMVTAAALPRADSLQVRGINANLLDLPLLEAAIRPAHSKSSRLFCMLGGTLSDLDNEPRFFQYSLSVAKPGDMLLLDVPVRTQVQGVAEVSPWHQCWLRGVILRHCIDVKNIQFDVGTYANSLIPGTGVVDIVARVSSSSIERHFSLLRLRRYDLGSLRDLLRTHGWEPTAEHNYGIDSTAYASAMLLFEKKRR